jgi:hypothetical protein
MDHQTFDSSDEPVVLTVRQAARLLLGPANRSWLPCMSRRWWLHWTHLLVHSSTPAWPIHRRRHDCEMPRSFAIRAIGCSRRRASSTARPKLRRLGCQHRRLLSETVIASEQVSGPPGVSAFAPRGLEMVADIAGGPAIEYLMPFPVRDDVNRSPGCHGAPGPADRQGAHGPHSHRSERSFSG